MKMLFPLLLAVLTLISCAARIEGSIAADGSASVNVNMALGDRMTSLIRSLSQAGGQTGGPVLDGAVIAQSLANAAAVASASLVNKTASEVEGQVIISNINEFLSAAGRSFIVFEQGSSGGRCVINVDLDNGPLILELLSPEITGYLEALMAPIATGEHMSRNQYLDDVASVYNRTLSGEIASSRIRAVIDFPGAITSVMGGAFSGRRANFDIALLDLLVLETPLTFEVTWSR